MIHFKERKGTKQNRDHTPISLIPQRSGSVCWKLSSYLTQKQEAPPGTAQQDRICLFLVVTLTIPLSFKHPTADLSLGEKGKGVRRLGREKGKGRGREKERNRDWFLRNWLMWSHAEAWQVQNMQGPRPRKELQCQSKGARPPSCFPRSLFFYEDLQLIG